MIDILVVLHIGSGTGAVLGMIGALSTKKGGLWHRRMGKLYTRSMTLALLLALVVSALTGNVFLFLIALFSGYLVYTGWRAAMVKDGTRSALDNRLSQLMIVAAIAMMGYGIFIIINDNSLGIALAMFGIFAFLPAWIDLRHSNPWPKGKQRIVLHLNRMGGASIATLTAVFVVNVQTNPAFIAWLLPTMIGSPIIVYWTKRILKAP